jgi:hypothetical protein
VQFFARHTLKLLALVILLVVAVTGVVLVRSFDAAPQQSSPMVPLPTKDATLYALVCGENNCLKPDAELPVVQVVEKFDLSSLQGVQSASLLPLEQQATLNAPLVAGALDVSALERGEYLVTIATSNGALQVIIDVQP